MSIHFITSPEIIYLANISSTQLIILLPIRHTSLRQSVDSIYLHITIDSLNKALENHKGKNLYYSSIFLYIF